MIRDYKTSKKEHLMDLSWDGEPEQDAPYVDPELWDAGDDAEESVPDDRTGKIAYLREKTREAEEEAKSPAYVKVM